jgi:hypothetical protein
LRELTRPRARSEKRCLWKAFGFRSHLKTGSTAREQVTQKLADIDTGVKQSNLFWGRWDSSRWRTTAVGFVPPEGERLWHAENLFVQFDPMGVIKTWAVLDDKQLTRELEILAADEKDTSLDLSSPAQAEMRVPERDDVKGRSGSLIRFLRGVGHHPRQPALFA